MKIDMKKTKRQAILVMVLALVAGMNQACVVSYSISKSVTAAVKSVSDSSKSSSEKLSGDARVEQEFRDDMRIATRDLVASGASDTEIQRELGRVAELHGISHWEAEPGSLIAIGAGACQAGTSADELDSLVERLGHTRERERQLAQEGCRAAL